MIKFVYLFSKCKKCLNNPSILNKSLTKSDEKALFPRIDTVFRASLRLITEKKVRKGVSFIDESCVLRGLTSLNKMI